MTNIMFVHGAAANGKSWFDVPTPFIEEIENGVKKNNVKVVTLEGHDQPPTSEPNMSVTMEDYLKTIEKEMDGLNDWVLIGHSMGGMVISQFAADFPKRVKKLIYVTAILPRDGKSVSTILGITNPQSLLDFLGRVQDEFSKHSDPRIPDARSAQPLNPLNEPFRESPEFSKLPRDYIYCSFDGVILPPQQKDMVKKATGGPMKTTEHSLSSDHIVQLTDPKHLILSLKKAILSN